MPSRLAVITAVLLLGGCATQPHPDVSGDPGYRKSHLACYQQMMAAGGVGWGTTPNRHQYFMCMKARGYDV